MSAAATATSPFVRPRTSPKSSSETPVGVSGDSAIRVPRPNIDVKTTEIEVSRSSVGTREAAAIRSAATSSPTAPPRTSGAPISAAPTSPGNIACGRASAL